MVSEEIRPRDDLRRNGRSKRHTEMWPQEIDKPRYMYHLPREKESLLVVMVLAALHICGAYGILAVKRHDGWDDWILFTPANPGLRTIKMFENRFTGEEQ